MKKITVFTIFALIVAVGLAAACTSTTSNTQAPSNTAVANKAVANTSAPANAAPKAEEDAPASVKAAFPGAQSFTKQHKDIPKTEIAEIEKLSGAKVPDTDHHSYLAFSTDGGARKQIGAATIVKAGGKDLVVVYENKDGKPFIKEIRADGVSADFLKQFVGKGHDDKFQIKAAGGVDDATAKAITKAVQIDILTMQMLYGAADKH